MKLTKEQKYGFSGSAILCLLIVFILSLIFLQTEIKAEEEGIPVNFGTVNWAAGTFEPAPARSQPETPVETPVPEVVPASEPAQPVRQQPVITQNTEQTATIEEAKEKERKAEQERQKIEQERREAEKQRLAEEQRKKDAINQQMSNAFGMGNTPGSSEGTASSGSGNQGSAQGNATTGPYTGVGGVGTFDLGGRSLRGGNLQRPAYDIQEEGSIVLEITVDPQGNVIQAEVRLRGTNIENANMRKSAMEAAKKTKFNAINGTQNQIGTITYRYTLK
jgi:TonB family protein